LTRESPQVRAWVQFAEHNGGTLPSFPLPLGEQSAPATGDTLTVTLLDEQQTQRFEAACVAGGARFIGGVLACLALTERKLTGADTYYGLTPIDTRSSVAEQLTLGWFTGWVPVTVPVSTSFGETARAAQESFDAGLELARVPFDRVVELAPGLRGPGPNWPLLNFLDAGVAPVSMIIAALEGRNAGLYGDGKVSYQLSIFVHRFADTTVTMVFPDNPVARESVTRYLDTMKAVCTGVADGRRNLSGAARPSR